jgi:hypothetical protein
MIVTIQDCEARLNQLLTKPKLVNPAVYTTPGMDTIGLVPHKIIDIGNLPMLNDAFFNMAEDCSYYTCYVEGNQPFYVINSEYIPTNNISHNSHNNHLRFGYGKTPFLGLPQLPFSEIIGPADEKRDSWWNECIIAAKLIKEKYHDICLCLSGGIDSELMVCAFIEANVEFDISILKYLDPYGEILNAQDFSNAIIFCNKHNLDFIIFPIQIVDDLVSRRYLDYYIEDMPETHFLLPTLYTQAYMIQTLNTMGCAAIMGSDQVEIKNNNQGDPCIGESLFSLGLAAPTWAHHKKLECVYDFFMYTPNQIVAYLEIPEVLSTRQTGYSFKQYISIKHGSKLLEPSRPKLTGYEKISESMKKAGHSLHEITMENIERNDWSRRASTQYIHDIKQVVRDGYYNDWQMLRTTSHDFLCRGFYQEDMRYYDI